MGSQGKHLNQQHTMKNKEHNRMKFHLSIFLSLLAFSHEKPQGYSGQTESLSSAKCSRKSLISSAIAQSHGDRKQLPCMINFRVRESSSRINSSFKKSTNPIDKRFSDIFLNETINAYTVINKGTQQHKFKFHLGFFS